MRYVYVTEEILDTITGKTIAKRVKQVDADVICKMLNEYHDGIVYALTALDNHKLTMAISKLEELIK